MLEYIKNVYLIITRDEKEQYLAKKIKFNFKIDAILTDITSKYKDSANLVFITIKNEGIFIYRYLLTKIQIQGNEQMSFYIKIVLFEDDHNFLNGNSFRSNCKSHNLQLLIENFRKINDIAVQNFKCFNINKHLIPENISSIEIFNTFIEFDNSYFALKMKSLIFLFEKFEKHAFLVHTYDISFMENPFPINLIFTNYEVENYHLIQNKKNKHEKLNTNKSCFYCTERDYFYMISSEKFLYKINLKTKTAENEYLPIFKDITLNFNNNKYLNLLQTLKLLLVFNLEIQAIPFNKLKNYMKNIFHEYDIYSYLENIQDVLSYENVIFFINHNFNSSKIYVILLYCIIFDKADFIRSFLFLCLNMDDYLSNTQNFNNDNLKSFNQDSLLENNLHHNKKQTETFNEDKWDMFNYTVLVENFNINKEFVLYLTCLLAFLKDFKNEFREFKFLPHVKMFFRKVFCEPNSKNKNDENFEDNKMELIFRFVEVFLDN